jgi:hypothetical protein
MEKYDNILVKVAVLSVIITALVLLYRMRGKIMEALLIRETLDEQIAATALKKSGKAVKLTADADGNLIIDKDLHPELYDWAVNG